MRGRLELVDLARDVLSISRFDDILQDFPQRAGVGDEIPKHEAHPSLRIRHSEILDDKEGRRKIAPSKDDRSGALEPETAYVIVRSTAGGVDALLIVEPREH